MSAPPPKASSSTLEQRPVVVLALLLVALGALSCTTAAPEGPAGNALPGDRAGETLTIGIVGDQTGSSDLDASYTVLEQGVEALRRRSPDVVLHVGDLVESAESTERIRADFERAAAILDRVGAPWYLTAGDHDVNPPEFRPDSPDRSREALFRQLYAERNPRVAERLYFSVDRGDYHLVSLYSQQALHTDPRWGNVFVSRIRADQLAWLEADLATHRDARAIVVFLHQPLWYHWRGWRPVHRLLREYPVAAVVAGHFHYSQDEGETDGIRYLVVGATGGRTKEGSPNAGDAQGVALLSLSGATPGELTVELVPLGSAAPLAPSPRRDMDLVQALDVQLGNLRDFAADNPVFVRDGELVADCDSGAPARLRLDGIGNPTPLPLTVELDFEAEPPTVVLDEAACSPGLRRGEGEPTACVLEPGSRTIVANTSSVRIAGHCPCGEPHAEARAAWRSGLAAPGEAPAPGTELHLRVRMTFTGSTGQPYTLRRAVATEVRACP